MTDVETLSIRVGGQPTRVWRKGNGKGPRLGFFAGFGGLPRWTPFLDALSVEREVIVPSLPGFPGADGHRELDTHLDWILRTKDLLDECDLKGADVIACSVGAGLIAEVAALWPDSVRRLVLVAPFGIFDATLGQADPWAQRLDALGSILCNNDGAFKDLWEPPKDADPVEWRLLLARAVEASARIYFPLGDTGLSRRLGRVRAPTMVAWGAQDKIAPPRLADAFIRGLEVGKDVRVIRGAGHMVDIDQPFELASASLAWTSHSG